MQQGDQYKIPIKIEMGGAVVTDEMVSDVRIMFDGIMKSSAQGEVTYDPETEDWLYPITQEQTRVMKPESEWQVGVKIGANDMIYSYPDVVNVFSSVIKGEW